jgi:hypothetical protein
MSDRGENTVIKGLKGRTLLGRTRRGAAGQAGGGDSGATSAGAPDQQLTAAVDLARSAAVEEAGADVVGDYIDVVMEEELLATHSFACTSPAYRGWRWAVTLARAPLAETVTVTDVVLLPGPESIVAPTWVPWSDRVRPGDLGVGDVLPTASDDPRLVPGLLGPDDLEGLGSQSPLSPGQWEIGLGRPRVLSALGLDEAVDRWFEGDTGPNSPMARNAAQMCAGCGFLLSIGGPVGQAFGICANEFSPADARVVSLAYGCGAHSEVQVEDASPVVDDRLSPDELAPGMAGEAELTTEISRELEHAVEAVLDDEVSPSAAVDPEVAESQAQV